MITTIKDPMIKSSFLSNFGSSGKSAPLYFAYRLQSKVFMDLILTEMSEDHLFHALDVAVAENVDGMEYVKALLGRIPLENERMKMLRTVNRCGETTFARAVWTENKKLKKREICRYFLDDVMQTEDDNIYYLTTPSLQNGNNPLREFVDNPLTMDLFTECMNKRLNASQRIEQLVFKSHDGSTILSLSNDMNFRIKLAKIIETALDEIKNPINDFDTLRTLFTFCFNNLSDCKYLDLVLSKTPKHMKHKLIVNYDGDMSHNAIFITLDRGGKTEKAAPRDGGRRFMNIRRFDSDDYSDYYSSASSIMDDYDFEPLEIMEMDDFDREMFFGHHAQLQKPNQSKFEHSKNSMNILLKHIEKSKQLDVLADAENPKLYCQSALEKVCAKGDKENFEIIKRIYGEHKEDFDAKLIQMNHKNESLLSKSIASGEDSISEEILNAIDSEAKRMDILNMRSTSDHKNVFDFAKTKSTKLLLKKTISAVLDNMKSNKLKYDKFIPYFHWLIMDNDLKAIENLFAVLKAQKSSINMLLASQTLDESNVIALSCTSDDRAELLEFLLKNIRPKDLRPMLMNRDEKYRTVLQAASKKCEDVILKHVKSQDINRALLSDVLCQDDHALLRRYISDKDELIRIFSYCDGTVLDEEVINKLLTECGWGKQRDEIRGVIIKKGISVKVTEKSMYLHVNPKNGNIPLAECMIQDNEKQFDMILDSIDLEEKENMEFLIGYRSFRDEVCFAVAFLLSN